MEKLQKEVEQLREQRNQQKQLADSSARQRDMYKALLTQSTGFSIPLEGDTGRPPRAEVVLNTQRHDVQIELRIMCISAALNASYSFYSSESYCCRVRDCPG